MSPDLLVAIDKKIDVQKTFNTEVKSGNVNTAISLIKKGVNLFHVNKEGNTPLMVAVANNDLKMVKAMLAVGVKPLPGLKGSSPLSIAIYSHHRVRTENKPAPKEYIAIQVEIVKQLIVAKADVTANSQLGDTLLIMAIYSDNLDIANLLFGAGIDINARNKRNMTALFVATEILNAKFVDFLLAKKAKYDLKTPYRGKDITSLELANYSEYKVNDQRTTFLLNKV